MHHVSTPGSVFTRGTIRPPIRFFRQRRLTGRLNAAITFESASDEALHGEPFTDRLRITNTGQVVWKAKGRRFGGQVTCGVKVHASDGALIREDLGRTPLPHDVPPGASLTLPVTIAGVLAPGRYELRYDLVVEGVTWFEFQGAEPARRALAVIAPSGNASP